MGAFNVYWLSCDVPWHGFLDGGCGSCYFVHVCYFVRIALLLFILYMYLWLHSGECSCVDVGDT